jgi:hypothetical protein
MQSTASTQKRGLLDSQNVMWWATMLTAVLAIPSLAAIILSVIQPTGMGAVLTFMLSCWACVYVGMKLVNNPKITFPYVLEQVTFSDEAANRCTQTIASLTTEMDNWKRTYDRCDSAFMSVAKQPAWGHMDELSNLLSSVRNSVQAERTVSFETLKQLNTWLVSGKPATVDAYMQALRGVYSYGVACGAEQGRDLNQLFPELEKGILMQFEQAPARMKAYAWELVNELRKQYPFIAAQLNYAVSEASKPRLKLVA